MLFDRRFPDWNSLSLLLTKKATNPLVTLAIITRFAPSSKLTAKAVTNQPKIRAVCDDHFKSLLAGGDDGTAIVPAK